MKDCPNIGWKRSYSNNKSVDKNLIAGWCVFFTVSELIGLIDWLVVNHLANRDRNIVAGIVVVVLQTVEQVREPKPQTIVSK